MCTSESCARSEGSTLCDRKQTWYPTFTQRSTFHKVVDEGSLSPRRLGLVSRSGAGVMSDYTNAKMIRSKTLSAVWVQHLVLADLWETSSINSYKWFSQRTFAGEEMQQIKQMYAHDSDDREHADAKRNATAHSCITCLRRMANQIRCCLFPHRRILAHATSNIFL